MPHHRAHDSAALPPTAASRGVHDKPGHGLVGRVAMGQAGVVVGRDVTGTGQVLFTEIGSGVLVSPDGKVMTAAHVVQAMDEITVEFLGGETVPAHVIASEPAADLSLLQLRRVPNGAPVAPMANS